MAFRYSTARINSNPAEKEALPHETWRDRIDRNGRQWRCFENGKYYMVRGMKRAFHLVLLIGALFGLVGGTPAYSSMAPVGTAMTMSGSSDCMAMMAKLQKNEPSPCRNAAPGCLAAVGCAVSVYIVDDAETAKVLSVAVTPVYFSRSSVLHGLAGTPEPRPPAILG